MILPLSWTFGHYFMFSLSAQFTATRPPNPAAEFSRTLWGFVGLS